MAYINGFEIEDGVLLKYTGDETNLFIPEEVIEIAPLAFFKQAGIESVVIRKNVKKIGAQAFFGCPDLVEVGIGEGVEVIEPDTFFGCASLKRVVFDKKLKLIKSEVFSGCEAMESIGIMGTIADWKAIEKEDGWDEGLGQYGVFSTEENRFIFPNGAPEGVTVEPTEEEKQQQEEEKKKEAEEKEKELKRLKSKEKGFKIAFVLCLLVGIAFMALTVFLLVIYGGSKGRYYSYRPSLFFAPLILAGVFFILSEIFSIKQNRMAKGDWYDGSGWLHFFMVVLIVFGVVTHFLCKTNSDYDGYGSGLFYSLSSDGDAKIISTADPDFDKDYEIPFLLDGYYVVSIEASSFENNKRISSLTIPGTVQNIGPNAFRGAKLKSVEIKSGVKTIQDFAFDACDALTQVTIPSTVEYIGQGAFCGQSLFEVTYLGTMEEWDNLKKHTMWATTGRSMIIHCLDGDIEK